MLEGRETNSRSAHDAGGEFALDSPRSVLSVLETRVVVAATPAYIHIDGEEAGQVYNEIAFRYFLSLERKRAERAIRPLLLLLVKMRRAPADPRARSTDLSLTVLRVLNTCVREVDFVGWYREGRIAGAVIAPSGPVTDAVRQHLSARVIGALKQRLPASVIEQVNVRVLSLGSEPRMPS